MKKLIFVLIILFVLIAYPCFGGNGFYIKDEPLSPATAKIIYQMLKTSQIRGEDSGTYIKICLSLERIINGEDVVIQKVIKPEKEIKKDD